MRGFYCMAFIERRTRVFSPNDYKNNGKIIYTYFENKMSSLEFKFEEIDKTINYLLDEINHYYVMDEKCKKTCTYSNYVLISTYSNMCLFKLCATLVCVSKNYWLCFNF